MPFGRQAVRPPPRPFKAKEAGELGLPVGKDKQDTSVVVLNTHRCVHVGGILGGVRVRVRVCLFGGGGGGRGGKEGRTPARWCSPTDRHNHQCVPGSGFATAACTSHCSLGVGCPCDCCHHRCCCRWLRFIDGYTIRTCTLKGLILQVGVGGALAAVSGLAGWLVRVLGGTRPMVPCSLCCCHTPILWRTVLFAAA